MPTTTIADALLIAAKDLQTALKGCIPQKLQTTTAVQQLMQIFKANAEASKLKEQESEPQRAQRECALRDLVGLDQAHAEAEAAEEAPALVNRGFDEDLDSEDEEDGTQLK